MNPPNTHKMAARPSSGLTHSAMWPRTEPNQGQMASTGNNYPESNDDKIARLVAEIDERRAELDKLGVSSSGE